MWQSTSAFQVKSVFRKQNSWCPPFLCFSSQHTDLSAHKLSFQTELKEVVHDYSQFNFQFFMWIYHSVQGHPDKYGQARGSFEQSLSQNTQRGCQIPSSKYPHIAVVDTIYNTWISQSQKCHPVTWESPWTSELQLSLSTETGKKVNVLKACPLLWRKPRTFTSFLIFFTNSHFTIIPTRFFKQLTQTGKLQINLNN